MHTESIDLEYGIYDTQQKELRVETYHTKEDAISEFAEYYKEISRNDIFDTFEFSSSQKDLTDEQKSAIVDLYIENWDNNDFLDYYGFKIVEIINGVPHYD